MLAKKSLCVGCSSCSATCPHQCIIMEKDSEGFLYPNIDFKQCISCGLCEKSCPILIDKTEHLYSTKFYAAQNRNNDVRRISSSGGIFYALALAIINQGGVVCAAKYSDEFEVIHSIATTEEQLDDFCGAKYAQSEIGQCFVKIKRILIDGYKVIFIGTPCQVEGLRAYLKCSYENLYLVDMVCHGVPSPFVWKKYLREREQYDANGGRIVKVNLRDKSTGWSKYNYSVKFDYINGKKYLMNQNDDMFMKGFMSNVFLRPSCSSCKFRGIKRNSDITIGDYWGIWKQYPSFDDNKGTSLVIIHSEKGDGLWNNIIDQLKVLEVSKEEAIQYNPSVIENSISSQKRAIFFKGIYRGKSVSEMVKLCVLNQNSKKNSVASRMLDYLFNRN